MSVGRRAIVVATLATLAASASAVRAETLCVKGSGKIVVRESCKKRERAVDPQALGLVGATGPAGPAGTPGADAPAGGLPYRVVDSEDRQFGTLVGFDTLRARVVVTPPGVDGPLQFLVIGGAFNTSELSPYLYYQEPDCAGPPFIFGGGGPVPVVQVFGTVGYWSRDASALGEIESREFVPATDCPVGSAATGRGTCCGNQPGGMANLAPAQTLDLSVLGVTPPFRVTP